MSFGEVVYSKAFVYLSHKSEEGVDAVQSHPVNFSAPARPIPPYHGVAQGTHVADDDMVMVMDIVMDLDMVMGMDMGMGMGMGMVMGMEMVIPVVTILDNSTFSNFLFGHRKLAFDRCDLISGP